MKYDVYNQEGKKTKTTDLPESVFSVPPKNEVLHQVIYSMESNARIPVAHTKDRSEVRGGGKKPWRQKGTGRARHGSIRSPLWRTGGVAHGPRNDRIFQKKINRKMAMKALFMALTSKVADKELLLVDNLSVAPKTSEIQKILNILSRAEGFEKLTRMQGNIAVIAVPVKTPEIARATANLKHVRVEEVRNLNVRTVLNARYLILVSPDDAVKIFISKIEAAGNRRALPAAEEAPAKPKAEEKKEKAKKKTQPAKAPSKKTKTVTA